MRFQSFKLFVNDDCMGIDWWATGCWTMKRRALIGALRSVRTIGLTVAKRSNDRLVIYIRTCARDVSWRHKYLLVRARSANSCGKVLFQATACSKSVDNEPKSCH